MRWSYKTVHFELKKEGILGSGVLDESEIEQELNEFGQSGWELITVLEVQDGIIVFFKQMLYDEKMATIQQLAEQPVAEQDDPEEYTEQEYNKNEYTEVQYVEQQEVNKVPEETDPHVPEENPVDEEDSPGLDNTIGAIKIE